MRRWMSKKTTCMRTDFCRSRYGSCCIPGRRRRFARSRKRCSKLSPGWARPTRAFSKRTSANAASSMHGADIRRRRRTPSSGFIGGGCCASRAARTASGCTIRRRRLQQYRRCPIDCVLSLWCTRGSSRPRRRNLCSRSLRAIANSAARVGWLTEMIRSGELRKEIVDGVSYVSPAVDWTSDEAPRQVRFLAPFDPVVWDRARFEHLWGWSYRFEAYTPVKKRVRGYYAMPMLWGEQFVGWANVGARGATGALGARGADELDVSVGYVNKRPRGAEFRRELDAEIARLDEFLHKPETPLSKVRLSFSRSPAYSRRRKFVAGGAEQRTSTRLTPVPATSYRREESAMSNRLSRTVLAVLLAFGTIGVSTQQRPAPATDATSRAVAAAEAFLATLDRSQRAKANIDLNEKTRTYGRTCLLAPRCRWAQPSGMASGLAR